jgi:hypothetical protein
MDQVVFYNFPEYLFYLFYLLLTGHWGAGFDYWAQAMALWATFVIWSTVLFLLLATGTIYFMIRIWQIRQEEAIMFSTLVPVEEGRSADSRWARILQLVSSDNPNDWRQGVIEADVLLDLALQKHGYPGDSLGERLKSASGLRNINGAWEAHKVRNAVAHAGEDFILTERDAREAIQNYYSALTELGEL